MTTSTKRDAIEAAMSVADDVANGTLDPADLERQAVAELTQLVGTVTGPDDPLWDLQVGVTRGVLAAGGIAPDELAEWTAVGRRRENPDATEAAEAVELTGVLEPPKAPDVLDEASSDALEPYSGESAATPADTDPVESEPGQEPQPPVPVDRRILARGRGLPSDNGLRQL